MPIHDLRNGHERLYLALTAKDIKLIRKIAVESHGWVKGRQGTDYYKLDVRRHPALQSLQQTFSAYADPTLDHIREWDAWLVYYPFGSYVPRHTDPVPSRGLRHMRINICVTEPKRGGTLHLEVDKKSLK